jgi:acyl-CoA synthetase (AMP-forming)/AMP-acid ligase II/acyl carrier protein
MFLELNDRGTAMSGPESVPCGGASEVEFEPDSLVGLLRLRAAQQPDKEVYRFLADAHGQETCATYAELDRRARAIGAWLQSAGATGERVLMLFAPGLDCITAFFGCLYAKAVAVPAYPPRPNRKLDRLQAIVKDARPALALTTRRILSLIEPPGEQALKMTALRCQSVEEIEDGLAAEWMDTGAGRDTLAFLQYTSGSTATPKGVMVSHGNLLHNERMIKRAFQQTEQSIVVGWLPLFHDMGLIGNVLQPVYLGARCILMSPMTFLQRPLTWLEAISLYRATTSGGPNFAYDLCVRKVTPEQIEGLDLSSWSVAFNGSEQVSKETMDRFAAAFRAGGFQREAFLPCYGLAEATLFVSGERKMSGPLTLPIRRTALDHNRVAPVIAEDNDARSLTSCGKAGLEQQIRIVDSDSCRQCPPDQVGEIWVSGPSVAQGYWNRSVESKHTFQAFIADTGEGPFLRTGDLGFVKDGELYITGRLKDLLIIRGRNHYPEDIERTAQQSYRGLRPGGSAAFSVEVAGEEQVVVVQEIERGCLGHDLQEIIGAIRQAVAEVHELHAHAVALTKPGSIPKTSSGKVQRHACRAAFLADTLDAIESSILEVQDEGPQVKVDDDLTREEILTIDSAEGRLSRLEGFLAERVARMMKVSPSPMPLQQPLARLGLDSLKALELQNYIESTLHVCLPMATLLQDSSIAQLASQLAVALTESTTEPPAQADVGQRHALSYGQYRLWFLDQLEPGNPAYNISVAFRLTGKLNASALEQAVGEIVARHESLRTTFVAVEGQPRQTLTPPHAVTLPMVCLGRFSEVEAVELAEQDARRRFDLAQYPLYRIILLRHAEHEHVLLISLHHIISDGWSVGVFFRELFALYESYSGGNGSPLPDLPAQYADFAEWQRQRLQGGVLQAQPSYWKQKFARPAPALELLTDRPRPARPTSRAACHRVALSKELSAELKALGNQEGCTPFMTLLTAFNLMLHCQTRQVDIVVGSPIAGRNKSEFEGLIGFFLNTLALRTDLSGDPTLRELLGRVRQVTLGAYANQDFPFERLVSEVAPGRESNRSPLYQVWFVLLIEPPTTLTLSSLTVSPVEVDSQSTKVDLSLILTDTPDGITGKFEYPKDLFRAATIAQWAEDFEAVVEHMIGRPDASLCQLEQTVLQRNRQRRMCEAEGYERTLHQKLKKTRRRTVSNS